MSLKSFVSKIVSTVASLFGALPAELKLAAQVGVTITQTVKSFVDSPAADVITALIPGDIDDKIKTWLRVALPTILTDLKLVAATNGLTDPNDIVTAAVKVIQSMDGDIQSAFLHDIGVLIAQEVAKAQNHTLSWSDGIYIIEWYYQHKVKTA